MKEEQRKQALESMKNWLAHPSELGTLPSRIECVGEFIYDEMIYFMFKYKKSFLSLSWMIGVCGGYEHNSLEHCGHVFSEMQKYSPATAQNDCMQIIERVKNLWEDRAASVRTKGKKSPSFFNIVLLDSLKFDRELLLGDLKKNWGVTFEEEEDSSEKKDFPLVYEYNGMFVSVMLIDAPMPFDTEIEHAGAESSMCEQTEETTKKYVAHLIISIQPRDGESIEAGNLLVKIVDSCLQQKSATAVCMSDRIISSEFYTNSANDLHKGHLPVFCWFCFGVEEREEGTSAYTLGLSSFDKDEIEVLNSTATPHELVNFLIDTVCYVVTQDVYFAHGETLGSSEEERFLIERSEGVYLDDMTLKIHYKSK